jgi:hypothetical protein
MDPLTLDRFSFERELAKRFQYGPPQPAPAEIKDVAEGQALDAAYLTSFPDFDRSYSPQARNEARRQIERLKADARTLGHEQFVLRVAEIAALADNAHTTLSEDSLRKNTPRLPLRAYWFADGLHVLRAVEEHKDLLGARIEAIDGRAVEDVYGGIRRYSGGAENWRRLRLIPMLESPALLAAAGFAREPGALTLAGVRLDGSRFERRIAAQARDRSAPVSSTARLLFPSDPKGIEGFTSLIAPGAEVPVYLREPRKLFTIAAVESNGLYIGIGFNRDADEGRISEFLSNALARIANDKPRFVVVDFRMNGGGDYTSTYPFMPALVQVAGGKPIYALISGWTFSAAITSVAALKTFGGNRVTLVGEPVGDRLDFWAEGARFVLPNSFTSVSYSTARHTYSAPCMDTDTCFWLNYVYPVKVESLNPEVHAPLTFAAYREGRDPAMEAVLARESVRP